MNDLELVYGFVESVRYKPLRVRVCLPDADNMLSPWAVVLTARTKGAKHFDPPVKGEQVAMLLMDDGESALCLGSIFSEKDTEPTTGDVFQRTMPDGTVITYDANAKSLVIAAQGLVNVEAKTIGFTAETFNITATTITLNATQVVMNAAVTITKTLMVALDIFIGILSLRSHRHKLGGNDTTPPVP